MPVTRGWSARNASERLWTSDQGGTLDEIVRSVGATDVTGLALHDHVCWAYSSDEEYDRVISRYFDEGMRRGERLAWYAPPDRFARMPARIGGISTRALIDAGRLITLDADIDQLRDPAFDPTALLQGWRTFVADALSDGFEGLRAAGEAGWVLQQIPERSFERYEFGADVMIAELPITALCCYDARSTDPTRLAVARAIHPAWIGEVPRDARFSLSARTPQVLALGGEVDMAYGEAIREMIDEVAEQVHTIDLTELSFVDVVGLRAVAHAARGLAARHGVAHLMGMQPRVERLWTLLQLDDPSIVLD